jgi:hypothetical protein
MNTKNISIQSLTPIAPDGSLIDPMSLQWVIIDPHKDKKIDIDTIPAITYENGIETRYLVSTDCGHICPIDPTRSLYSPRQGIYFGKSSEGKHYCHFHAARCQKCGVTLCTQGDSDAFKVVKEGIKPYYVCEKHYVEIKSEDMKRSFLRGFLGRNSGW